MSRSVDPRPVRSSALVDADTQFDLDLSDLLDQYPDGVIRGAGGEVVPIPAPTHRDETPAVPAGVTDVHVNVATPPSGIALTTVDPAVAAAVNPSTSVHPVFVTPPAGTPVVGPPIVPASAAIAARSAPDRRSRRRARRRTRTMTVLAGVLAVALVAAGVGLAFATRDGDRGDAAATSPGGAVALPPADAQKPADDTDPGAVADESGTADDAIAVDRAADAVTTFLSVRGTEAERAVSSQAGRAELDGVLTALGATSAQGAPACTAAPAAGTFACVLDTDRGPVTFTVGPDVDDPASSGFEVIGAAA